MSEKPLLPPLSRRSFLVGGVKIGLGLTVASLGLEACSARTPARLIGKVGSVVSTEPRQPANHIDFITRPDLHPPGVTVRVGAAYATAGLGGGYVFCAPKSPLSANPGPLPPGVHRYPPGATHGLMILDPHGELVWFKPLPAHDRIPFNFRVQTYRNQPVLTWFEGVVGRGHALGGRYILADTAYRPIAVVEATGVPCDLHEFLLTDQGTALHTAYQPGVVDSHGRRLVVGHAQEVDVATNQLLFDWPCYPAVDPELSYTRDAGDYFHINSIDLWPDSQRNLLISSRNTSAVYLVDRQTKQVIWRLGGKRSDFAMGPGSRFWFQHDARPLGDGSGVSLFDDASQPCPEKVASGKVLAMNSAAGTVTLRHRYFHTDEEFSTPSQGNCQLLPNGGHVVGWGYQPYFSVYAPSASTVQAPLILDGRFPNGAASYRTFLFDWIGRPPASELRLVVRPTDANGHFTAWASWNGATEVAAWRLSAGRAAHSLATVATVPKRHFETRMEFAQRRAKVFEVAAVDQAGRTLGRSGTVTATSLR